MADTKMTDTPQLGTSGDWFGKLTKEAHQAAHPELWEGIRTNQEFRTIEAQVREDLWAVATRDGLIEQAVQYLTDSYDSEEELAPVIAAHTRYLTNAIDQGKKPTLLFLSTYSVPQSTYDYYSDRQAPNPMGALIKGMDFFRDHVEAQVTLEYLRRSGVDLTAPVSE